MFKHLQRQIERQILKAKAEGQLEGLEGEGMPLPDRSGEAFSDTGEAVGYRLMAQAGALPEEIGLRKEMTAQRARLAELSDPAEQKAAMAELARLELRYNIAREARQKFMR